MRHFLMILALTSLPYAAQAGSITLQTNQKGCQACIQKLVNRFLEETIVTSAKSSVAEGTVTLKTTSDIKDEALGKIAGSAGAAVINVTRAP